jgi:hypothetical protein
MILASRDTINMQNDRRIAYDRCNQGIVHNPNVQPKMDVPFAYIAVDPVFPLSHQIK